jgi:tryptophan-rich sensory protein
MGEPRLVHVPAIVYGIAAFFFANDGPPDGLGLSRWRWMPYAMLMPVVWIVAHVCLIGDEE